MTSSRTSRFLVVVAIAATVAACSATTSSASPGASTAPPATSATPPASSVTPATPATPTVRPSASPTAAAACPIAAQTGRLPSDRMIDVTVATLDGADIVTFTFGESSLPEPPQGVSEGLLEAAAPPYVEGASGLPVDVTGEHVARLRFSGMSIMNDVGLPTYDGRMDFRPEFPALRTLVNSEMFEGVIGWYIGYDGGGCVTLGSDETSVTVTIAHTGP